MKPPDTIYRGQRLSGGRGEALGVRVTVTTPDGHERLLSPQPSRKVHDHSPTGFEWGYGGSGPAQLALALVLDATGDAEVAERSYQWFKWAAVAMWGDRWQLTAGEILTWLDQWRREDAAEQRVLKGYQRVRVIGDQRCRVCGCTDDDCSQCIAATGIPCSWVEGEDPPICTRCAMAEDEAIIAEMEGGGS